MHVRAVQPPVFPPLHHLPVPAPSAAASTATFLRHALHPWHVLPLPDPTGQSCNQVAIPNPPYPFSSSLRRSLPSHRFSPTWADGCAAGAAGALWGEVAGGGGGACVEIRADLYREGGDCATFDVEAAMQAARAAVAHCHARALAHVLFTVRSEQEGGLCPPRLVPRLLQLAFRMGCEIVDIEATMCSSSRSELLRWLQQHFPSPPSCCVSAILSSVHVTNASVVLHDDHMCARSLAVAAACEPAPHALKFAAIVTDDVTCARMQQQAQQAQLSFGVPVCCVAMAGESAGRSVAAVSRLRCPTLTFCRPESPSPATASGAAPALSALHFTPCAATTPRLPPARANRHSA